MIRLAAEAVAQSGQTLGKTRSSEAREMQKYGEWEVLKRIGGGGQSDVYLVRTPARSAERARCLQDLRPQLDGDKMAEFAESVWSYSRPDSASELAALKVFKIPRKGSTFPPPPYEAIERLKKEIMVLSQRRLGLPELLDSNEDERWIVTELFSNGTLADHYSKYRAKVLPALRTFRSLVATVASLHREGYVHRDIKPANVFLGKEGELILGDFGIVYMPSEGERVTLTNERVGPRTYMPPWGDFGDRLEDVQPNFDVYMLAKLLWCMIAGRLKLPRELHRREQFDLVRMFPDNEQMHLINPILDQCLVLEPGDCLTSAQELLTIIDDTLAILERGIPLLNQNGKFGLPCRMCGKGYYQSDTLQGTLRVPTINKTGESGNPILLRIFVCNVCTHYQFFAPGMPDEAAAKGWPAWTPLRP